MDRAISRPRKEPWWNTWGFCFVHNDQFYLSHDGWSPNHREPGKEFQLELPLQRFDFSFGQWSGVSTVSLDFEPMDRRRLFSGEFRWLRNCSVCCAVLGNCAYTFGGDWKYGYAVHELNLETMLWRRIEPQNREDGPMDKTKAGMVTCGDDALCVFGGYGRDVRDRRQPGATYRLNETVMCGNSLGPSPHKWNNELHLFHIKTGTWSSPETTGPRPPPCEGCSFTKVDSSRVVVFGGTQLIWGFDYDYLNELHILDMNNWHWSGAILPSSPSDLWPRGRYLHSACVLFDSSPSSASQHEKILCCPSSYVSTGHHKPQLFLLWGLDKDGKGDAWILDVNSITWKPVKLPSVVDQARYDFSLGCYNRSPTEAELVVFGGRRSLRGPRHFQKSDTTLLHIGLKTLYHSCVDYVAERYKLYQPLLQQLLPPRIQTDIYRERDKRAHFIVAQL